MRKDERSIFFFDLTVESHHRKYKGMAPLPHFKLIAAIQWLYDHQRAETTNRANQAVYIADFALFDDRCEMLISFADTLAADPAFADRRQRKRRIINKVDDEGLEHSAHVIWKFGKKDNASSCPFLLEHAPGLASSKISRFLNALLRLGARVTPFERPDPAGLKDKKGNFKSIKVRPIIELAGHPSAEFIKDLKAGQLQDIELFTTQKQGTPWDGNGHTLEERSSVTLRPNPTKILPKAKAILDAVTPGAQKQFEFCKVRFKTASDVSRSVTIHSDTYNLVSKDGLYVRKERITELGGELPTAFEKIHPVIIQKMRTLV